MELFLIKLVALIRPLASLKYAESIFDIAGIALFLILSGALLANSAMRKAIRMSAIDWFIVAFALWCLSIYVIYFESARIKDVAKLLIPLLSYIVVKNIVRDRAEYNSILLWILVGFSIPIVASAGLIATGRGVDYVSYWTDLPRWLGAYTGAHSLGHSMALFIMVLTVYWVSESTRKGAGTRAFSWMTASVSGTLVVLSLYCLYMSQVRSAVLGLITFGLVFLYFFRKTLLVYIIGLITVVATLTVPYWLPALLPELAMMQRGVELEVMDLGSDRPRYWLNDIAVFAELPIDQKLAGVGIGAIAEHSTDDYLYGHNDWLQILTQTGLVGLGLFVGLQIAVLLQILKMSGKERHVFLALFVAVNVMMLVSNSYVWRIQVAQLYYMVLAFIEIQRHSAVEPSRAAVGKRSSETRTTAFPRRDARAALGVKR